jgi:hypothetical protein
MLEKWNTASEIARHLDAHAREVNLALFRLGFITGGPGFWTLTPKAEHVGRSNEFYKCGQHYSTFQWKEDFVLEVLKPEVRIPPPKKKPYDQEALKEVRSKLEELLDQAVRSNLPTRPITRSLRYYQHISK